MLLNSHINREKQCKSNKFPLLFSSGSRQNYTLGTSDEGVMAFRKMEDVNCLVSTLMGGDCTSWFDMRVDEDINDDRNHKKKRVIISAADRVLTRASDRALGVVSTSSSQGGKKRKQCGWYSRFHVVAYDSDDDHFSPYSDQGATSLVDWLSEPSQKKKVKDVECEEGEETDMHNQREGKESTIPPLDRLNKDGSSGLSNSADKGTAVSASQEKTDDSGEEEDKDDIEDGYIAL